MDMNMFRKERHEHPTLSNEDVKTIVSDHEKEMGYMDETMARIKDRFKSVKL